MEKVFAVMASLVLCFGLTSCGHKSDKKLTDAEQFKCSDSIQTVFDILGETELKTGVLDSEYYKYEDLNLWGYNGTAVFNVRDDKDTIQSFHCSFTLDEKEFEDVLSQLENKYGEYEKHEYSNQIAYVWEISEDEADKIGYNEISFSDYGDKKAIVKFSDEWSMYKDEAYYEHLEEEKEVKVLAQKTYDIGEDTFNFMFGQKGNGDYSFNLTCQIADKADAFYTHISLNALFNSDDESIKALTDTMNFTYSILIGDGTLLMRSDSFLYLIKDDEVIEAEDYFSPEWLISDEYQESDYGTQVTNFLVDFIENE